MTDKLREQISALVDGELDEGEARLLVRRFESDPSLREVWDRYQRCARLLDASDPGGEHVELVGHEFREGVMAAIEEQPPVDVGRSRLRELLRPVAGLAVAASVATVALVGLQGGPADSDGPESVEVVPGVSSESGPWSSPARFSPAAAGTRLQIDDTDPLQRLNTYRINHADRAAGLRRIESDEARDEAGEAEASRDADREQDDRDRPQ